MPGHSLATAGGTHRLLVKEVGDVGGSTGGVGSFGGTCSIHVHTTCCGANHVLLTSCHAVAHFKELRSTSH